MNWGWKFLSASFLVLFLGASAIADGINYVQGPGKVRIGNGALITVNATGVVDASYVLVNPSGAPAVVNSTVVNESGNITFSSAQLDSLGNWSINVSDANATFSLQIRVIEDKDYRIVLLESIGRNANRTVKILSPAAVNVSTGYQILGTNITKSGIIYTGNTSESSFGCDITGDSAQTSTIHVWVSDPDTSGDYTMAFLDDDAALNETAETGRLPKNLLSENSPTVKCAYYLNDTGGYESSTDLGPYNLNLVWQGGVYLMLQPGPGDRPFGPESNISLQVLSYNGTRYPIAGNVSAVVRYKSGGAWSETPLDEILSNMSLTGLSNATGADGLSNTVEFNLSGGFTDYLGTGAGEYAIIVNEVTTETFRITPAWTANVLIGDPITETEKYSFRTGDSVAATVETTANTSDNFSILAEVYDPDDDIQARWTYNSTSGGRGIFYDSGSEKFIAGLAADYSPLLNASAIGTWRAEVTVASGSEQRYFERAFEVKSYETTVFAAKLVSSPGPEGMEPKMGRMDPGGNGFIGVFATQFGVGGDLGKNLEEDDLIAIDPNVSDANNSCNASIVSLVVTDPSGSIVAQYPESLGIIGSIDNLENIVSSYGPLGANPPEVFKKQCMAYIPAAPSATGEYMVTATLNVSGVASSGSTVFSVEEIDSWAEPWDINSNHFRWHFNPGANVTLKINAEDVYTHEEISPSNIVEIQLLDVFNPDFGGSVLSFIDSWGYGNTSLGGDNTMMLWVDLGNTSGFHQVSYRIKAVVNASGTLRNATATGSGEFETKLYDIRGHPDFDRQVEYYKPDEDINLTVEVWGPEGPAGDVDVYVQYARLWKEDSVVNVTAARATTNTTTGRAQVTIRKSDGTDWAAGEYDVRIRVKDSSDIEDYGWGWFDVKSFEVHLMLVDVENGSCEISEEGDYEGPPRITGNPTIGVIAMDSSGFIPVTMLFGKSRLFQITNLNGEPVSREVIPDLINNGSCNLTDYATTISYFTMNTSGMGGHYEVEVVVQDNASRLASAGGDFFIAPFTMIAELMQRGEPVYAPGESLRMKLRTASDSNITNLSILRVIRISGNEELLPDAANAMNSLITWENSTPSNRRIVQIGIPTNVTLKKGEYIIQMRISVQRPESDSEETIVHDQWLVIKPFTYSIARLFYSWAGGFNTTETFDLSYWSEDAGSRMHWGSCPFPQVNSTQSCAIVNKTAVRQRIYDLWSDCEDCLENYNRFVDYYNDTAAGNMFEGFHMIVGPVDYDSVSSAKVYVARDDNQLSNASLVGLSVGDTITDASGAVFSISRIRQNDVTLRPVKFARSWELKSAIVNLTNRSQSGEVKMGVIVEGHIGLDFNGDGSISERYGGLPFVLFDSTTSGIYDTVLVDTDLDLRFDDETLLSAGGAGTPLLNVRDKFGDVTNKTLYLIKADLFDVIFAFNESGFDNWVGTNRVNSNVTIPIYSATHGINLSIQRIFNERERAELPASNYTVYNATVGSDGMGMLKTKVTLPGNYRVQFKATSGSTIDIPEPWESPFLEVRAFDTQRDILEEVASVPAFSRINGSAARLSWWDSRGYQEEWIESNGTLLETILANLPDNFDGSASGSNGPWMPRRDMSLYVLYNKSTNVIYMSNTTSGLAAASPTPRGSEAFRLQQRWPDWAGSEDTLTNITFSFDSAYCWGSSCQLVVREKQPQMVLQQDFETNLYISGDCIGRICPVGFTAPKISSPDNVVLWIDTTWIGTNRTTVLVNNDLNYSTPQINISFDGNGIPNNTANITITKDVNEESWCVDQARGCPGGTYVETIRIHNLTWDNDEYGWIIRYYLNASYENGDYWAEIDAESGQVSLDGPSDAYYVRNVDWKGVWMVIDVSNSSQPMLYMSTDGNFTNATGYAEGDTIPLYDKWLNYSVPFNLLSLYPKTYTDLVFALHQNRTFSNGFWAYLSNINTSTNMTYWSLMDNCQDCEPGYDSVQLNNTIESRQMIITIKSLNATHAVTDLTVNVKNARWGYDTSGLNSTMNATFYNESYQKLAGMVNIGGVNYTVVALDSNGSSDGSDFTVFIVSNDTTLSQSEVRQLGDRTTIAGSGQYLSGIRWESVVFMQNTTNVIGAPYSDDGLGYYITTATPSAFSGALANNTRNYTLIMYAEERWDEPATMGKIRMDDDANMLGFDDDCSGDYCYDRNFANGSGEMTNESGVIAESEGEITQRWSGVDLIVKNSSGAFRHAHYNIWDANASEPVRLVKYFDGWWGDVLTNTSNITMGLKVRNFDGTPVAGTADVTEILMVGEFFGEWRDCSLETDPICANLINYTLEYDDGMGGNTTTLDSDGIMFIRIMLSPNSIWREGYGYEIRVLINDTSGNSEETSMWFDMGMREGGDGSGGGEGVEACNSVVNQTVCDTVSDRCTWKAAEDKCTPKDQDIDCAEWDGDQAGCAAPCIYNTDESLCFSCNEHELQSDDAECTAVDGCGWVSGECWYTG